MVEVGRTNSGCKTTQESVSVSTNEQSLQQAKTALRESDFTAKTALHGRWNSI